MLASLPKSWLRNVRNYPVCKIAKSQPASGRANFIPMGSFYHGSKRPSFSHHRSSQIFLYCRAIFLFQPPLSGIKYCHAIRDLSQLHPVCSASRGTDCLFGCPPHPARIIFFLWIQSHHCDRLSPQTSNNCTQKVDHEHPNITNHYLEGQGSIVVSKLHCSVDRNNEHVVGLLRLQPISTSRKPGDDNHGRQQRRR